MLALGIDGNSFKGSNFGYKFGNTIRLNEYITEGNTKADAALLTVETAQTAKCLRGRIFKSVTNKPGFLLMTDDCDLSFYCHIGDVLTGLKVVDQVASDKFAITDIIITNCGIVLDYDS